MTVININENNFEEEIDLRKFFSFLLRNKILISVVGSFSFAIACLYSLSLKRVWEGQFQIVLNKGNKSPNIDPQLANFVGINLKKTNELQTEVEILKSPSVLMPVFEFAKSKESPANTLRFSSWKTSLDIELEKGTSVLNISYKDID